MGTPQTIDFFDKQPAVTFPINEIENYTQRSIFKQRQITGPNPEYRRLFNPDHPNETPQLHQSMGLLDEVRALRERLRNCAEAQQKLMDEVRQNMESQDNFKKRLDVRRKFAQIVRGSSPLFAVQDVVKELLKACDDETRKQIQQFRLQESFEQHARSEANQLPAAYQWLLEQSTNGDKSVQDSLGMVHSKVTVMSERAVDARSMLNSLESYKEAQKQRNQNGHPCILFDKEKKEDIINFVKDLAEGDEPLPEPYTDRDRELVKKAVSRWLKMHDQEAGTSAEAKRTKGKRSKKTKKTSRQ